MGSEIAVTVKEVEPANVAFLARRGPYSLIRPSFGQLYEWIGSRGHVPSGPPILVCFNSPDQVPEAELAWELRSPIAVEVTPSGPDEQGLGVKKLPAALVASTMHQGPYEKLAEVYPALAAWIAQNGYRIAGPSEEVYFTNPAEVPPERLLTEVRFPVRRAG